MATTHPPNVATGEGSIPPATAKPKKPKPRVSAPATPPAGTGKYQWGSGGKVHSISLARHQQDAAAVRAVGGRDLTAPPDALQAYKAANASADLQYGPQLQAAQQLQTNLPAWYSDYLARVAGYASTAQKLAQPAIDQSAAFQNNTATAIPAGIDPNSVAGQQAQQAAQGRAALAQLGTDALKTNAQSTQAYFGGLQAAGAHELPQAQTAATNAVAQAQTQRGNAVTSYLTTARQNAQNYAIARGTLNLNSDKAKADSLVAAGYDPTTGKKLPPKDDDKLVTSGAFAGLTNKQVRQLDPTTKTQMRDAFNKKSTAPEKPYSSGAFAGMTPSQLARHSRSWIQQQIDDYTKRQHAAATTPKPPNAETRYEQDFYAKYGVKPASTQAVGNAQDAIKAGGSTVAQIRASNPHLTREQVAQLLLSGQPAVKDDPKTTQNESSIAIKPVKGLWATVALDIAFNGGFISAGTANQLHHAGYSVAQLGLKTLPGRGSVVTRPGNAPAVGGSRPT